MSLPDIQQASNLLKSGQLVDARMMLQNLLHQVPNHLSARVLLARLNEAEGDDDAALTIWKQAAYLCPGNVVIESGLRDAILNKQFGRQVAIVIPKWDLEEDSVSEPLGVAVRVAKLEPLPPSAIWVPPSEPSTITDQVKDEEEEDAIPELQDLDKLIQELGSASIVPNPDIPMLTDEDLEQDLEDVVSETLARIYANQSYFKEASVVYEKLAEQKPGRAEEFMKKAAEMKQKFS